MPFRFTTAGESHGPGLTAVIEGLPAGLELTPEDIDRDLARRQLGHGRGGRMKIEKDRADVTSGVRHGRDARRPDRPADRQPRLRELGGADEPVAGRGRRGGGAPAAPRPRRPRRRAEVRLHRRAQRARARQRPRDHRARGRRARWPRPSCARSASRSASHVIQIGSVSRARAATTSRVADFDGSGRVARALPRRGRRARRWWRRSTPPGRRTSRSAASTR